MFHGFGLAVGCDDDFYAFREVFGQPEGDVALFVGVAIDEVVDALEYKDYLVVDNVRAVDGLAFQSIIAELQPISKIFPQFLLMQFDLLPNIECLPQLHKYPIERIEIITIIASCSRKMQQYQILLPLRPSRLMILIPLTNQGLLADSTLRLNHQRLIVLDIGMFYVEPVLNGQDVLLEATSALVLVVAEHGVGGAELQKVCTRCSRCILGTRHAIRNF